MKTWAGRDILSVSQFSRDGLDDLFKVADEMKNIVEQKQSSDLCKGKLLCNLFYEPSTRTSSSFHAAMLRLGGSVMPISAETSSVKKGETLQDTVRCLECYSDVIVLRHPEIGSAKLAASYTSIPLLNAGDGAGEHPTQALLDIFTIFNEFKKVDGLTITMLGDLKNGRTVHSLARLLSLYNVKLQYVSPDFLRMPEIIQKEIKEKGIDQKEFTQLDGSLKETDILYVTRIQKERFTNMEEYKKANAMYRITPQLLEEHKFKSTIRIMHPLPRLQEISEELDNDPRAAYFRQMKCGLYVRMALLALTLGVIGTKSLSPLPGQKRINEIYETTPTKKRKKVDNNEG